MQRDRLPYLTALGALVLAPVLTLGIGPVLGDWVERANPPAKNRGTESSRWRPLEIAPGTPGTQPALVALAQVEGRTFRILVGQDGLGQTWSAAFTTED